MRQQTARYFTDCSESPVLARAHSQAAAALYDRDEAEGLAEQMSLFGRSVRGRCQPESFVLLVTPQASVTFRRSRMLGAVMLEECGRC
jgi:hypothetical protein